MAGEQGKLAIPMLVRLLRTYLRPYRRLILLVLLFQALQATSGLWLPRINASIIDQGVAKHDTGYIWTHGTLMLLMSALQVVFMVTAVYFGSRAAAGFGAGFGADFGADFTGFDALRTGAAFAFGFALTAALAATCARKRSAWSSGSFNSEKALPSSRPPAKISKRSASPGSSSQVFASGESSVGKS